MSRQIRRQIPQKQKKKRVDRNACLLVFILIFSGILTFLLLTARDNSKLNSTLDETFGFVKNRIESYEIYNTNDQVKSLVRLLDKTTELSRVIEQEGNLSTEMLNEYAREQRLTGILVLDQNLKVTEQSAKDGDTMSLWQKLIKSDYVRDIAEHPEKTYTTRLRNKGKIYDFAAVARQDAAGINVIKYKYLSTCIGAGLAGLGGLYFVMEYSGGTWTDNGFGDRGWLAVALVIFALWKPLNAIWGAFLFGALYILYLYIPGLGRSMQEVFKALPYVVTIIVLVFTSFRKKKEHQPPAALGLPYFREER